MHHICVFEDSHYSQLVPLVYTRAVFELRCGLLSFLERIVKLYPNTPTTLFCRNYLSDTLHARYNYRVNDSYTDADTCLFLNGRAIFSHRIPPEGQEEIGIYGNTIVYARLKGVNVKSVSHETFLAQEDVESLKVRVRIVEIQTPIVDYFWDIIKLNKAQIASDFTHFVQRGSNLGKLYRGAYLIHEDKVFIGENCKIKPCCVLDAEYGPIYIDNKVTISPNTTIEGPAYVGSHSVVMPNTRLRGGTNLGEFCKVGGELSNTIIHSYSNKQHDGFLGDSYVGSWVNLGADTVNSNLLNTYGNIKVEIGADSINTNQMFLGAAIGDHAKTAINTVIMTGSIFGFACNIVTPAYPPKYLPSFTWYSENGVKVYTLEKALQVAKIVMNRRGKAMSFAEELLFKKVFELTEREREAVYGKRHQT